MALVDVIIVGGGPAGLNAAVVLGRCQRKVILFDNGQQRNIRSHGMHNYLTRDGISPADFIRIARQESRKYGVELRNSRVKTIRSLSNGLFRVEDESGGIARSGKILLATGLSDNLPQLDGLEELYGKSVFHCPYCDGWEVRDKVIGVYAKNKHGLDLALSLTTWSRKVVLFTDGKRYLKPSDTEMLAQYKIKVVTTPIVKLVSSKGKLREVVLVNGKVQPCEALFFANGYSQKCDLVESLGCIMSSKKVVITNRQQQTNIPGVYVAGDASLDMHFVVVAAAEGAKAGVTINKELQKERKELVLSALRS